MSRSTSAHLAFQLANISADMLISAVSGSPFRYLLLSFPERGGEECHDGEDLQPSQEHTCGKHEAPQGVDDLEALRRTDLSQAGTDVVQGRRHRGGGREGRQLPLERHDKRRYTEYSHPCREEPEDRDAHGLRHHAPAYLKRCDRARMDHPEDVLEDRAEDNEDADDLDPARCRTGASPDEHEQDEGDLGCRVPPVEVSRYKSRRGNYAGYRERRVPERPAPGVPVVAFQNEDPPHEDRSRRDDPEVCQQFPVEQDVELAPGVKQIVEREGDTRCHHEEADYRLYGERVIEADRRGLVAETPRRNGTERMNHGVVERHPRQ